MHAPCSSTEEDVVSPEPFGALNWGEGCWKEVMIYLSGHWMS